VKSAGRVLKIFEFFDDIQAPGTAGEICATLGYPQVQRLAAPAQHGAMGYLHHDRVRRQLPAVPPLGVERRLAARPPGGQGAAPAAMEDLTR
jgi:hypothetical protein